MEETCTLIYKFNSLYEVFIFWSYRYTYLKFPENERENLPPSSVLADDVTEQSFGGGTGGEEWQDFDPIFI